MILDQNLFIETRGFNGINTASLVIASNYIDLLQARDLGEGAQIYAHIRVISGPTGGTNSPVVSFKVIMADTPDFLTNPRIVAVDDGRGIGWAIPELITGTNIIFPVGMVRPFYQDTAFATKGRRYLSFAYHNVLAISVASNFTDGTFSAGFLLNPASDLSSGIVIPGGHGFPLVYPAALGNGT